ncbi:MAG TPA: hypothetical protein VM553_15795 [Dongiaceae bacterium]|nr:hypothetical protein [Dongiaceae bacterium]
MKDARILLACIPFLLTACGGGGSSSGSNSSTSDNVSQESPAPDSGSQQLREMEASVYGFSTQAQQAAGATSGEDLSGVWLEVSGNIWSESGVEDGESIEGSYQDRITHVHFVKDNGTSIDISDCSSALRLYTFHFSTDTQVTWSNFPGDNLPVGTIKNNRVIEFGTTAYNSSKTTTTGSRDSSGQFTSRWVKLSSEVGASIGTLSGYGTRKNISCANILTREGERNGDNAHYYSATFRDTDGEWIFSDSESGNDSPSREGLQFSMSYDGAPVKFTLK